MIYDDYKECRICPRNCGVNRYEKVGVCGERAEVSISSYLAHHGEEPPVSGKRGSGTIFFTGCSLRCAYCQNFQISQLKQTKKVIKTDYKGLYDIYLELQGMGVHNINLVTPSHFLPDIEKSIKLAKKNGFNLPFVYNSGGYENVDAIKRLEGLIDIYLVDMKYSSREAAKRYSFAPDYPEVNLKAVKEMFRQQPEFVVDSEGILKKGVIIRHLVLPENLENSFGVLKTIYENFGSSVHISVMSQYSPVFKAHKYPEINRTVSAEEFELVVDLTDYLGFENGWIQELESSKIFLPDFTEETVFKQDENRTG